MKFTYEDARRIREHGVTLALHLDVSSEAYVRAGEILDCQALVVDAELSAFLYQRILDALEKGAAVSMFREFHDEAARGLDFILTAGEDRQAAVAPLLEALAMDRRIGGRDPFDGFLDRERALTHDIEDPALPDTDEARS